MTKICCISAFCSLSVNTRMNDTNTCTGQLFASILNLDTKTQVLSWTTKCAEIVVSCSSICAFMIDVATLCTSTVTLRNVWYSTTSPCTSNAGCADGTWAFEEETCLVIYVQKMIICQIWVFWDKVNYIRRWKNFCFHHSWPETGMFQRNRDLWRENS